MALLPVDVANMALARLGERSIASFGENSPAARAINRLFAPVRDLTLGAIPWRFAEARVTLTPSGVTPLPPWTYQYLKPADCIDVRYLLPSNPPTLDFSNDDRIVYAEGNELVGGSFVQIINAQVSGVILVYTRQLTDPTVWDSDFVSAFSIQLAADVALPITGDQRVAMAMRQAAAQAIDALRQGGVNEGVSRQQSGSSAVSARR